MGVVKDGQWRSPLVDALRQGATRPHAPFYTPGHKRGQGISPRLADLLGAQVFRADLPELPDLDNLFAPTGPIRDAQDLAADLFGADQTWFLANGSTCGIEAAILATCQPGDPLILPRNAHQSAIAALILSGARPIWVNPVYDPGWDLAYTVSPSTIQAAIEQHPDARAVLLVSPTYQGVCADIAAIARLTQAHGLPLIVDEAHGAHCRFHPDLPTPALESGADIAIQSTHKTLGAMTQAAMLHLKGDRICPDRLRRALQLVQSTSPSYLLLASLDAARHQMADQGHALMQRTLDLAQQARDRLTPNPHLRLLPAQPPGLVGFYDCDPTRLTIDVTRLGWTGFEADDHLHNTLGVTAELPSLRHLTFILSLGTVQGDVDGLVRGLEALDVGRSPGEGIDLGSWPGWLELEPGEGLSPREAFFAATEVVAVTAAGDRLSGELVCPYPPGIPVLVPGEPITQEAIAYLQRVKAAGGIISGCSDPELRTLTVIQTCHASHRRH